VADATWDVIAALVDPVRRALYDHVRHERRPVTREDAARALDISRSLAAFHLDKLVEVGMLHARYEAPPEQPRGRGRSPKVYEASSDGLTLTVPPRQYEVMATILTDAVAQDPGDVVAAACRRAQTLGSATGATVAGGGDEVSRALSVLAGLGYEPRPEDGDIVLGNCPFHPLAARHTALVCGINVEFVTGLLTGLGCDRLRAELRPDPDGCCVRVVPR
jgi:predicted ArsR family transcriptional regulator